MLVVGEPALKVWNTFGDVNMNLVILNNNETLSIKNTSKVVVFFNLTHDVFDLDSNHDHSVLVAFFIFGC